MTLTSNDLDKLTTALDTIASRVASDPEYRQQLQDSANQPAALYAAGISAALLSGALQEAGAEEADVAGFDFGQLGLTAPGTSDPIIVNTLCVTPKIGQNSCKKVTLTITIKTNPRP